MKKILAWICLISVLFSFGALADTTTLIDVEEYGNSADNNIQFNFAVANDVVYLFTWGGIDGEYVTGYSRVEAPYDVAPEVYQYPLQPLPGSNYITFDYYSDGETIWTWQRDGDNCKLYTASFEATGEVEYEPIAEFPLYAEIEDEKPSAFLWSSMIYGDFFIGLIGEFEYMPVTYNMEEDEFEFYEFDDEYRQINVLGMMPYTDETVLLASSPSLEDTGEIVFYELNLAEGELNEVLVLPMVYSSDTFGYVYDQENELLYFMSEGVLYRLSGLDPDSLEAIYDLGYLYRGWNGIAACHASAITSDGHYIVTDGNTLLACDISGGGDSAAEGASLKILGPTQEYYEKAAAAYVQASPGSKVSFYHPSELEFDLTSAVVSKSDTYDIYILQVDSSEYGSMYQRGYLLPMENGEVTDFVDGMYPNLREAAVKDGSVVALPLSITSRAISYDPEVLEALGYTQADLPSTWHGFLEFLCELPSRLEDTDYTAFPAEFWVAQVRSGILRQIVNAACLEVQNGEETFDTPAMREILKLFEQVDFDAMGLSPSKDEMLEMNDGMYLFTQDGSLEVNPGNSRLIPLVLSLDEGNEPLAPTEMVVAVVNPYSNNRQAAEEFLAELIKYLPDESRANLRTDWVGGVKMEGADENLAGADEEIALIQAEIENAADEETREAYEAQLEEAQATRERVLERFYWKISEEVVARYQAAEKYVQPIRYMGLDIEGDINPMMQKYLDGSSDSKTFISELDSKLRMRIQEMQ